MKVYFEYLDALRESGATNMFGAGRYLRDEFEMDEKRSREVLSAWMSSFDPSKSAAERAAALEKG